MLVEYMHCNLLNKLKICHRCRNDFEVCTSINSTYSHLRTRIATSRSPGKTIAVGSQYHEGIDSKAHNRAEWYDTGTNSWEDLPRFPYKNEYYYYAVLNINEDFIYFGGIGDNDAGPSSRITKFESSERTWNEFGWLRQARHA